MDLKEFAKVAVSGGRLLNMIGSGLKSRAAQMPNKALAQRTLLKINRMKPKIKARVDKATGAKWEHKSGVRAFTQQIRDSANLFQK